MHSVDSGSLLLKKSDCIGYHPFFYCSKMDCVWRHLHWSRGWQWNPCLLTQYWYCDVTVQKTWEFAHGLDVKIMHKMAQVEKLQHNYMYTITTLV